MVPGDKRWWRQKGVAAGGRSGGERRKLRAPRVTCKHKQREFWERGEVSHAQVWSQPLLPIAFPNSGTNWGSVQKSEPMGTFLIQTTIVLLTSPVSFIKENKSHTSNSGCFAATKWKTRTKQKQPMTSLITTDICWAQGAYLDLPVTANASNDPEV